MENETGAENEETWRTRRPPEDEAGWSTMGTRRSGGKQESGNKVFPAGDFAETSVMLCFSFLGNA